tara:strand:- start:214 stop:591 length:378 start_codon:yes stop_codon:yes gene_type:complete
MVTNMAKKTGPTNPELKGLLETLEDCSRSEKIPLWKRVADDLGKSSRSRRVVNLSKLNRFTKADEVVVVPGKVLGSGVLSHKLTVTAFQFSGEATKKIVEAGGVVIPLQDFIKESPKGKRVRVIG